MRKLAAEFLGTFFLVFAIVTSVLTKQPLAPLAIGVTLVAMVFAGGHISGAHFNPAVTLAVWIRGKIDTREVPGYLAAQSLGSVAAAAIGHSVAGTSAASALTFSRSTLPAALVAEALVTFALAYVVLNVATSSDHAGNSFYGLAIGFTVMAGAISVGGISGGVFNPAVALGVATAGLVSWSTLWVYLVADLAGAAAAALAFRALNPHEWAASTATPAAAGQPATPGIPAPRSADSRAAAVDQPA